MCMIIWSTFALIMSHLTNNVVSRCGKDESRRFFAMSMHDHKPNEYHYIDIIHFVRYTYKEGPKEAKKTSLHKIVQDEAKVVEAM